MKYTVSILALMVGAMLPGAAFAFDNGEFGVGDGASAVIEIPDVSGFVPDASSVSKKVLVIDHTGSSDNGKLVSTSTAGAVRADGSAGAGYKWVDATVADPSITKYSQLSSASGAYIESAANGVLGDYLKWTSGPKSGQLVSAADAAAAGITANSTSAAIASALGLTGDVTNVVPSAATTATYKDTITSNQYTYNAVTTGTTSPDGKSAVVKSADGTSRLVITTDGKYTVTGLSGVTTTGALKSGSLTTTGDATVGGKLTVGGVDVGQALATGTANSVGLAAITATVDGHTQQIGTIKGDIVTLQTDAGVLTGKVDAQGVIIDAHGNRISTIEGWKSGFDGSATGGTATMKSTTGATTTVNGDGFVYNDGKGGKVEIGGDPTVTITNGTSTTKIVNGSITNNGGTNTTGGTTTDTLHVTGASVFDNAVTINTGGGHTTTVNGSGATFANTTGNTKVDGGNVTSTGTTKTGSLDVQHDANVGGSVNVAGYVASSTAYVGTFSGNAMTGGSSEIGNALTSYGAALSNQGARLDSLENWQSVAKGQITDLQDRSKKAFEGTAIALAAQNFTLETGKRFGVSAAMGTFEGETALASSVAFRLDQNWQINGSVGFGTNNGTVGARAGVVGQW